MNSLFRRAAIVVLLLCAASSALGRTKIQGYAEQGGQRVTVAGFSSSTYAQRSYPSCVVTVYVTGTLTLATLYSDASGTSKANPFTAGSDASWSFYVDDGIYDVRFSAGTSPNNFPTTPYTWSGIETSAAGIAVSVKGFGAKCDGSTDDTVAIQAAVDLTGGHTVLLPAGTCKTTDQILISQDSITIEGTGTKASTILYVPTVDNEAAFKAKKATATTILYPTFRNFFLQTTDTTFVKYGLWLVDSSNAVVEHVQIGTDSGWRGGANVGSFTGTGSIGIRTEGRDFGRFYDVISCGAIPFYVGLNPNEATIDLDHTSIIDFYFIPYGDNPNVFIADGANLTNVVFERGAFVKGGYGVYWNETGGQTSRSTIFRSIRGEQFTSAGHMLYLSNSSSANRAVIIDDILCGTGTTIKGIYLRGIGTQVSISRFIYNGTIECLNADSTVEAIDWYAGDCEASSTVSLGTLVEEHSEGFADSSAPIPLNGRWESPSVVVTSGNVYKLLGVKLYAGTGTLANTATVQIPSGAGSITTGSITISFRGATLRGAFACSIANDGIATLATSDATIAGCTGNVAGDITLHYSSASSIVIRNQLGESVVYNYQMFWN